MKPHSISECVNHRRHPDLTKEFKLFLSYNRSSTRSTVHVYLAFSGPCMDYIILDVNRSILANIWSMFVILYYKLYHLVLAASSTRISLLLTGMLISFQCPTYLNRSTPHSLNQMSFCHLMCALKFLISVVVYHHSSISTFSFFSYKHFLTGLYCQTSFPTGNPWLESHLVRYWFASWVFHALLQFNINYSAF